MMKADYIVLLTICWILISISPITADSEVKEIQETNLDPKGTSTLNKKGDPNVKGDGLDLAANSKKVHSFKDGKDQENGSEKGVKNSEVKEGSGDKKQTNSEKDTIQEKEKDNVDAKKKKPEKGSESKEASKEEDVTELPVKKEGSHVEECDVSNSCKDEKVGLVACFRVPGNESPEFSLLVQNKGKGPLMVTISAPDFVHLEKTQIQLKESENNQVKVSISKPGKGNSIVLTAGKSVCKLDFQGLLPLNHNKDTISSTTESASTNNMMKKIPLIAFIIFGALVIAASAWMCISFQKRLSASKNSKYQKLDMDLPVSGGAKVEFASSDGWDDSWGDDWDDEEAPKTPLLPPTPSLSAKGLAPRKLNKEAWKK